MKFSALIVASFATSAAAFSPAGLKSARTAFDLDATIADTVASLEGPGQVWGADGIAVGKEESDFKGFDNFGLFYARLQSSGVAATLAGPGPFTVFAPTDTAIQTYETMKGPVDASVLTYCIVPGAIASGAISSADLTTLSGAPLKYKRQFRKDFVNDAIVGEKTFGQFSDFPTDVQCDNGVIHSVGIMLAPDGAASVAYTTGPAVAAAAPAYAAPVAAAPVYAAPVAAAPVAAAPVASSVAATGDSMRGKYEGSVWDMAAKLDVYGEWNPATPRSAANFSPFETWEGNSPDCSGFFPGEGRYKDPARPDVSYAIMQAERVILDEMTANPKPGFTPGCAGCRT
jgi:uncharacterized surface protein with fasciclin (FAS1) repeats